MQVTYLDAFSAWADFRTLVDTTVQEGGLRNIAEVGAGANPLFSAAFAESIDGSYHLIDSSAEELRKAGPGYIIHVLDIQKDISSLDQQFDLIIAQMTLEHISDPKSFFENVHQLLRPGGKVCLFFASVTSLPMLVNKFLPDSLSRRILLKIQPFRQNEKHGKFTAFYRWCFGPTRNNIRNFENAGFGVDRYTGYFGHSYYERFPLLNLLEKKKTAWLLKHPQPGLCTYGQVVLSKK